MARLPYLNREDLPESERDLFDKVPGNPPFVPNVFRMMAHAPGLLRRYRLDRRASSRDFD
ncbi:MAG: hypothetical protein ACREP6_10850 [Candidatus Binataceae bacterium]